MLKKYLLFTVLFLSALTVQAFTHVLIPHALPDSGASNTAGYRAGLSLPGPDGKADLPLADTDTPTPTDTPPLTVTATETSTETLTPTLTQTAIPTDSPTPTGTDTSTPLLTQTATNTAVPTLTDTPTDTPTGTDTPTNTAAPTGTATPTQTSTASPTTLPSPVPTNTATKTATNTPTSTSTPSRTPTPTRTITSTPQAGSPTPTPTKTSTLQSTATPTQTATHTPTATPNPNARADLALSITDHPDPIRPGVPLTYTLTITNNGPSAASDLVVTDTLSNSVVFTASNPGSPICSTPAPPANQIICFLVGLAPQAAFQITVNATIKSGAVGQIADSAVVSSATLDPNPNNNHATAIIIVDTVKPQVDWVSPVADGQGYFATNQVIPLIATPSDDVGVAGVEFYRWDKVNLHYVDLGYIYNAPYEWNLNVSTLYSGWNEIDISAYDTAGNVSDHKYIFVYRPSRIYAPLVTRK
jgi:uncharacterized repeat protein (TIGR01451 family)